MENFKSSKDIYFILDNYDFSSRWVTNLKDVKTESISWIRKYRFNKWNKNIHFIYIGKTPTPYKFNYEGDIKNLSLMKSSVQKSYRRCETDKCLQSYKLLCRLNSKSALKRLGIIILEDSFYTKVCNSLIWMIICHNYFGFELGIREWNYVFSIIKDYCDKNLDRGFDIWTDPLWLKGDLSIEYKDLIDYMCMLNLDNGIHNTLLSLLLYNDKNTFMLEGDKVLGYYFIRRIIKDISDGYGVQINNFIDRYDKVNFSLDVREIPYIEYNNINPAACDFHCDPKIIYLVKDYLKLDDNPEDIKSCIWYMSSRLNKRNHYDYRNDKILDYTDRETEIQEKYGSLWDKIKEIYQIYTNIRLEVIK